MVASEFVMQQHKKMSLETMAGIALFVALLILIFFVRPAYDEYIEKSNQFDELSQRLSEAQSTRNVLEKSLHASQDPQIKSDMEKYALGFREDKLIDALVSPQPQMSFGNISFAEGEKLTNGLSFGKSTISFQANNTEALLSYLEYLTSEKSVHRFVISDVNFPFDSSDYRKPLAGDISVGVYYFAF